MLCFTSTLPETPVLTLSGCQRSQFFSAKKVLSGDCFSLGTLPQTPHLADESEGHGWKTKTTHAPFLGAYFAFILSMVPLCVRRRFRTHFVRLCSLVSPLTGLRLLKFLIVVVQIFFKKIALMDGTWFGYRHSNHCCFHDYFVQLFVEMSEQFFSDWLLISTHDANHSCG